MIKEEIEIKNIRSNVGNEGKIVSFLDGVGVEVSETGLYSNGIKQKAYTTSGKNIAVITVQTTSLLGDRTGSDVDDTGKKFTSNLKPIHNQNTHFEKTHISGIISIKP